MLWADTHAIASEVISSLEAALAISTKAGERLAHELLHSSATPCIEDEPAVDDEDEREYARQKIGTAEDDEPGQERVAGDDVEAELADVERQLAELRAEDEAAGMGGQETLDSRDAPVFRAQVECDSTKEEEAEFDKEMQAMLCDARDVRKAARSNPEQFLRLPPLGPVLRSSNTGSGLAPSRVARLVAAGSDARSGGVTLRVLRRGARANKLEADEVRLPLSDSLAQTVITMDEKAQEERQMLKRHILAAADDQEGLLRAPRRVPM